MQYIVIVLAVFSSVALAEDSTALAAMRRGALEKISFYCPIGRTPLQNSADALAVVPSAQCRFNGPLDTAIDPLSLQPPFLNPVLQVAGLKNFLALNGAVISGETAQGFRFSVAGGPQLSVSRMPYRALKDRLMKLKAYPPEWGDEFTTISASRAQDFAGFVDLARKHPEAGVFWDNPHVQAESKVYPRLQSPKNYLPIELESRCAMLTSAPPVTPQRSLLIVGDLHDPPQSAFFLALLDVRKFAWVGLEFGQELQPQWQQFYDTADSTLEARILDSLVDRFPANIQDNFRGILRKLKAMRAKVVFTNSYDIYFNLPYTNVSFHGLIVAARNYLWAQSLPADWQGQAVLFGGLDHFTNFPGSDFQNFASERYPGLPMTLVNPLETCAQMGTEQREIEISLGLDRNFIL